jgi:peptidoglycan/LPS O-acetylase OafA/YrhL
VLQAGPLVLWWELHIGVTLFFVLSGFVITWRYDRRGLAQKRESFLRGYFVNRFARIYPLYFVLVVPVMLYFHVRSPSAWFFNLTIFTKYEAGIPQAWSLRVEECFYVLAPAIFLLWKRNPFVPLAAAAAVLVALYPLWMVPALGGILGAPRSLFLYSFFGRFFEFYVGIWLAKRVARAGTRPPPGRRFPVWTAAGIAGIGAVVIGLAAIKAAVGPAYMYGLYHPAGIALNNLVLPVFIAAFYWGLIRERSWVRSSLSTPVADLLGRSSYAFYLIHINPVLTLVEIAVVAPIGRLSASAAVFLAELLKGRTAARFVFVSLAAIVLYKAVELPANRFLRRRFGGRVVSPVTEASAPATT